MGAGWAAARRCRCGKPLGLRQGLYCSRECFAEARLTEASRTCRRCGVTLEGDRRRVYCSSRCSDTAAAERTCRQCGKAIAGDARRVYCSQACTGLAQRKTAERPCAGPGCTELIRPKQAELDAGGGKFCSWECRSRARRKALTLLTCEQCGDRFEPTNPSQGGRFCGRQCFAAYRREGEARPCEREGCENIVRVRPNEAARGRGHFCSQQCYWISKRRRVELTCERCKKRFTVEPSRAKARPNRFCSWRCKVGRGGTRTISCQLPGCGRTRPVKAAVLALGYGRFCSRSCWGKSRRQSRPTLVCAWTRCRKSFTPTPSQAARGRHYCSWEHFRLAKPRRRHRCAGCPHWFTAPPWREQRFCSAPCAYRKRHRRRYEDNVARDRRVMELRSEGPEGGLPYKTIKERLEAVGIWISVATIRSIVWRVRHGRFAPPRPQKNGALSINATRPGALT